MASSIARQAIQRADSIRQQAYGALESIPKKLESINELLKIHFDSAKLKLCADAVFVSIFDVLHVTVNELSKSFLS